MATNKIDATHQIGTPETDTSKVLTPDGAGGVQWGSGGTGAAFSAFQPGAFQVDSFQVTTSGAVSPLTTKGDVWGFSTVDARVPIGTNAQVLTADSTQALGLKWATPTGGGATIQYPALKPATPTDDFAAASLGGGYTAHSSGGTFATTSCMTQGIDWMGSSVELQFSGQFGGLYTTHADADFDFTWGGVITHLPFQEASNSEVMVGIAALNSAGTGVGVLAYTADTNGYFATITTWNYASNSDSWTGRVMGTTATGANDALWFRLKRVSGTWTGYMSKSGRVWDKTFSTRADSITVDRLYFGLLYDNTKLYSGRLTADYYQLDV